MNCLSWSIRKT